YYWESRDDPFAWRGRLGFARVGLAELWIVSGAFFAAATGLFALTSGMHWIYPLSAVVPAALGLCIVWFFRDPRRAVPQEAGLVVSPADGKVVEIREIEHDEFIGGPALLVGVFLSVFNVHINRMPAAARVIGLSYRKGKF